tara:strand:- start:753 stop:1067 length:315 start_codon:yes stop_codon:yes gene_type:complete
LNINVTKVNITVIKCNIDQRNPLSISFASLINGTNIRQNNIVKKLVITKYFFFELESLLKIITIKENNDISEISIKNFGHINLKKTDASLILINSLIAGAINAD